MNSAEKLLILILITVIILILLYQNRRQRAHQNDDVKELTLALTNLQQQVDAVTSQPSSSEKWSVDVTGYEFSNLDTNPYISSNSSFLSFPYRLAHNFSGTPNVPYDVELTTYEDGQCDLVVEEAPKSEAASGVYTSASQEMYHEMTTMVTGLDSTTFTVTPSLTDSIWLYTCKGGATIYPLTLRVREQ
jgi:hypothetical protein